MRRLFLVGAFLTGAGVATWAPGCGRCGPDRPGFPVGDYVVVYAPTDQWADGMEVELARADGDDDLFVRFTDADGAAWEVHYAASDEYAVEGE